MHIYSICTPDAISNHPRYGWDPKSKLKDTAPTILRFLLYHCLCLHIWIIYISHVKTNQPTNSPLLSCPSADTILSFPSHCYELNVCAPCTPKYICWKLIFSKCSKAFSKLIVSTSCSSILSWTLSSHHLPLLVPPMLILSRSLITSVLSPTVFGAHFTTPLNITWKFITPSF